MLRLIPKEFPDAQWIGKNEISTPELRITLGEPFSCIHNLKLTARSPDLRSDLSTLPRILTRGLPPQPGAKQNELATYRYESFQQTSRSSLTIYPQLSISK